MKKQPKITLHQRAERLKKLITYAKNHGFNQDLIKEWERQLLEVRTVIQADKDKRKLTTIERGLS
jgi:chorismate mutase